MKKSMINNYDELPMFINANLLAELFGVSRASAYELMREKNFPSFRIGKRILVSKENLRTWIESRSEKGGTR
jgi:excisionase family DNA binding protein